MHELLAKLQPNPDNPRKDITSKELAELKESIKNFPEMLQTRQIVYDENFIVQGGNKRLLALRELEEEGFEILDTFFISCAGWTNAKKKEFIIKDNTHSSQWDDDILIEKWGDLPLQDWGIETKYWFGEEESEDSVERLDKRKTIKCPECGHEFTN